MSVRISCCENFSVRKLFCDCRQGQHADREEILYRDTRQQIIILSTPHVDYRGLVVFDDLPRTDIATFAMDDEGDIRFVSLQGLNMFHSVVSGSGPDPDIKTQADFAGRKVEDVLPPYLTRFLIDIYSQTLQGNFLQLSIMWMGVTHIVRTFPIFDHRKQVVAGKVITSPFNNEFSEEVINRFALNRHGNKPAKRERRTACAVDDSPPLPDPSRTFHGPGPEPQLMQSTHSGMLKSSIVPNGNCASRDHSRRPSLTPEKKTQ
jgi:hypothetical protein